MLPSLRLPTLLWSAISHGRNMAADKYLMLALSEPPRELFLVQPCGEPPPGIRANRKRPAGAHSSFQVCAEGSYFSDNVVLQPDHGHSLPGNGWSPGSDSVVIKELVARLTSKLVREVFQYPF
ncbi:hypothetical protein FB451DRAFT_1391807 [Mycena latifolia]|nr:hypothetical protein FB451DRAFT_1391807 [Mycena latifolia]